MVVKMAVALLSMIASTCVFYYIIYYKELQQHPNMLIAYTSFANIMVCWALIPYTFTTPDFVCYMPFEMFFKFSVGLVYEITDY